MNQVQPSFSELSREVDALRARVRMLEHADREQYEHSLSLLQATLESTADGLLVVDTAGKVVLYNQQFLQMWGIPQSVAATGDDAHLRACVITQLKDPVGWTRRVEELYERPDEESFDEIPFLDGRLFERYSKPQRSGGQSIGRVWSFRDVTERRRAEQRLRESEARHRFLFSNAPISIWETDFTAVGRWLDGLRREGVADVQEYLSARPEAARQALGLLRVLDVNEASLAVFEAGTKLELMTALPMLFTDETYRSFGNMLAGIWAGRTRNAGELAGLTLKGRPLNLLVHWVIPTQGGGPDLSRVVIALDDLTERVRLQRELLKSQKLESVGTLAGGIAHDFNNLLAVIVGQASMQLRGRSLSVRLKEALKDILHAAERGSALTQQLLAYARGGLQQPMPMNLNGVVESVMKILRRILPPQVEFSLELTSSLPQIVADPSQIEQVVMNLCLNAGQASPVPGRVEVKTEAAAMDEERAKEWGVAAGEYVRLRVRDFGQGMDAATIERIFEPFYTTKPEGRGMGLAVSQGIVRSHRGHIEVASKQGRGTTMTIWLPAVKAPRETARDPVARPRTAPLPRGSETILLIDDDPAVSRTVETILSSLGYCVVAHVEPEAALSFLESNAEDVHLVLLDANLPRYSLNEMFERVRMLCPHAPILLGSGYDLEEQCLPVLQGGAAGFIQKPFSLVTLATRVRAALDKTA